MKALGPLFLLCFILNSCMSHSKNKKTSLYYSWDTTYYAGKVHYKCKWFDKHQDTSYADTIKVIQTGREMITIFFRQDKYCGSKGLPRKERLSFPIQRSKFGEVLYRKVDSPFIIDLRFYGGSALNFTHIATGMYLAGFDYNFAGEKL